ncbi:hypothetical protein [Acidipila sp. EB88]|uniref:hypothetical protein n=1 Tax=Acidipila sp. EB88 TaxID=2305226 RepID=UPI000F5EDF3D|nr:hypothetical protein [Acidipila sp. EB88]
MPHLLTVFATLSRSLRRVKPVALAAGVLAPALLLPMGCSVAASGGVSSAAQKAQAGSSTGVIPSSFFGMVVKAPAAQPGVATGARRLWDSGVTWAALEPARGSFAWATLDAEVAAAQQAGAEITLCLGMTPQWASSRPVMPSAYGVGATAMPASLADWDTYVGAVATRYSGRIRAYEVWNAPETPAYWSGAPAQMGENMSVLAAHAAAAVHSADSAALVVSPALSPTGLAAFLMAGGGTSVDVVGSTLASTSGSGPEDAAATIQALRSVMAGTSVDGSPLWNDQGAWVLPQGGLSSQVQAAYVARALILNAAYGVQRMHWYAWDDSNAGDLALTGASHQPTESAAAFASAESWLVGAQMNGCAATASGVWTCQLVRAGRTEWVLWSVNGSVASSSLGASTSTDLEGNITNIAGGNVTVEASPMLLQ